MIVHAFLRDAHLQSPALHGFRDDAKHAAVQWHSPSLLPRRQVHWVRFLKVYRILAWPSATWLAMIGQAHTIRHRVRGEP